MAQFKHMGDKQLGLPQDASNRTVQIQPVGVARKAYYYSNLAANTEITLDSDTSLIEITSIDEPVFLRFGDGNTASAATDGFDRVILAGQTRHFALEGTEEKINIISIGSAVTVIEQ